MPRAFRPPKSKSNPIHESQSKALWWQPAILVLAVATCATWYLAAEHEIAGQWGFSLDDSWIYATFARNLAQGQGYAFNPGEHVAGATGPLYVFILAALYFVFHDVVWPAKVLGIVCLCASALILYAAVRRVAPSSRLAPLLAGILVATCPPLLWGAVSGMEICPYLLLVSVGLYMYVRGRWSLAVLCWSLGVWLRPDGIFLALVGVFARPGVSPRAFLRPALVMAVIVGAYLAFNEATGGRLLPNSVAVKAHPGSNLFANEWSMLRQWADLWGVSAGGRHFGLHAPVLLPAMAVGALLLARQWPALPVYAFLFPLVLGLSTGTGGQFDRYIVYVVPFALLLAVIGLEWSSQRIFRSRHLRAMLILGLICAGWQLYTVRKVGISHGWNVENINGMHRFIAEATHRAISPGDTIAVNDVGAMGYFSGAYVVDLVGLVSKPRPFPENLRRYRPKYLVVFPDWYQMYAAVDSNTNEVVFYDADSTYKYSPFLGVRLRKNTISSRNTMYLYERMGRNETGTSHVQVVVH